MIIRISLKSVYTAVLLLLLYHMVFVKFPYVMIQRVIAVILFPMTFPKIKIRKKDTAILILLGAYAVFTLISAWINKDNYVYTHPLVGGFFHVLILFEMFQIFLYVSETRGFSLIAEIFFILSMIYIFCNDFLVICYPELFRYNYLVGNKFSVLYKHIEWIMLYCLTGRKNIFALLVMLSVSLYISAKVNCMTGAVGIGILAVLLLFGKETFLRKRLLLTSIVIASGSFPFVYDYVTAIKPVQYFIVNILHRTAGMTGRTVIFDYLPVILNGHWLLGYGYNTAYEVWITATDWYPNAQNAFWNCVCEQGIICAILLTVTAVYVTGLKENPSCIPLMCVIYVYAVLGAVEITMDITFAAWLLLLYVMKRGKNHGQYHNTCLQRRKIYIRMH